MKNSSHVSRTRAMSQGRGSTQREFATRRTTEPGRRSALPRETLERQLASDRCEVDVVHLHAMRAALASLPHDEGLTEVAELLGLLSNPTRLRMLLALQPEAPEPRSELCVCDLATVTGASKSLTSHQLRLLRASGLVRQRRAGRLAFYRLADGPLVSLLADVARLARERNDQKAPADAVPVRRLTAAPAERKESRR